MKPKGSRPHSQQPAFCLYPDPDGAILCPHPTSRKSILILSSHLRLSLPSDLLPSRFLTKTPHEVLVSPHAIFPAHLSLLDLITGMMFGEEFRKKAPCYVVFSTPLLPRQS
jgi:hypothetical protein